MLRDYKVSLQDVLQAIRDVGEFIGTMTLELFKSDKKTLHAVVRDLEVIGEAIKSVPLEVRDRHPEVAWQRIAGLRDILIHHYFPGAQTERRGDAGPGRGLLGGRTSPAAFHKGPSPIKGLIEMRRQPEGSRRGLVRPRRHADKGDGKARSFRAQPMRAQPSLKYALWDSESAYATDLVTRTAHYFR